MASRPLAGVHVEAVAAGPIIHLAKGILVIRQAGKVFIAPGGLIPDIITNGEFHCFHSLVPKGKEQQLFLPHSVSSNGIPVKSMSHIHRKG